jgi:peptidoglycan/LPS O-acetylase OafA/YrhL
MTGIPASRAPEARDFRDERRGSIDVDVRASVVPGPARVTVLDGLRGLAAAYVVLHHCWLVSFSGFPADHGPWWLGWLMYGRLMVVFFLTLSGFSLALGPAGRGWRMNGAGRFLRCRAWRLIPAYWSALAAGLVISWWITPEPHTGRPTLGSVLVYGLMLQDVIRAPSPDLALWSIAVEAELCLALPLLLALRRHCGPSLTLAAVSLPVAFLGLLDPHLADPNQSTGLAIPLLPVFMIGVIASGAAREPPSPDHPSSLSSRRWSPRSSPLSSAVKARIHWRVRSRMGPHFKPSIQGQVWPWCRASSRVMSSGWMGCAVVTMLGGLLLIAVVGPVWIFGHLYWVDLIASVPFGLLLVALARATPSMAARLLDGAIGRMLGRLSYSLYLVHVPLVVVVSHCVTQLDPDPLAHFLLTVAVAGPLCLIASWILTVLIEEPAHHHGQRVAAPTRS